MIIELWISICTMCTYSLVILAKAVESLATLSVLRIRQRAEY